MGEPLAGAGGEGTSSSSSSYSSLPGAEEDVFPDVLGGIVVDGARADSAGGADGQTLLRRLWEATCAGAPRLREASKTAARDLAAWTRHGGAPRALLVVSVGSVALVALTGLLVVVFFVVVATTNAIVVSVLVSLAAAGGFLAVLLVFLAAIYVGVLSVAVFVISATTAAAVISITIATGWVAFFWIVWFAVRKFLDLTIKRDRREQQIP
ncbi:hypothetical protein ACP70R_006454 [Stipagrostis hirtigluma subsp. patula]